MNGWVEGWPEQIAQAQHETEYVINGARYPRIPYSQTEGWPEDWHPVTLPERCHDCGVVLGQLHVPSCDMERCPNCQGQAISCGCERTDF
jgi:hypothetical protein